MQEKTTCLLETNPLAPPTPLIVFKWSPRAGKLCHMQVEFEFHKFSMYLVVLLQSIDLEARQFTILQCCILGP